MLARSEGKLIEKVLETADPSDRPLAIMFGSAFESAVSRAKAAHSDSHGMGSSVDDSIVFVPPFDATAELQMSQNFLLSLYPDRRNVKGYLVRNATGSYLLYVVFDTDAGPGALYFFVGRWAKAHKGQ